MADQHRDAEDCIFHTSAQAATLMQWDMKVNELPHACTHEQSLTRPSTATTSTSAVCIPRATHEHAYDALSQPSGTPSTDIPNLISLPAIAHAPPDTGIHREVTVLNGQQSLEEPNCTKAPRCRSAQSVPGPNLFGQVSGVTTSVCNTHCRNTGQSVASQMVTPSSVNTTSPAIVRIEKQPSAHTCLQDNASDPTLAVAAQLLLDAASVSGSMQDHAPECTRTEDVTSHEHCADTQKGAIISDSSFSEFDKLLEDRLEQMQAAIMAKVLHASTSNQTALIQIEHSVCKCMADHSGLNRKINVLSAKLQACVDELESVSQLVATCRVAALKDDRSARMDHNATVRQTESVAAACTRQDVAAGLAQSLNERVAQLESQLQAFHEEGEILQTFQMKLDEGSASPLSPDMLCRRVDEIEAHVSEQVTELNFLKNSLRNLQHACDDGNFDKILSYCHAMLNGQGAISQRILNAETQLQEHQAVIKEFALFLQNRESGNAETDEICSAIGEADERKKPSVESISVLSDNMKAELVPASDESIPSHESNRCMMVAAEQGHKLDFRDDPDWKQGLEELNAKIDHLSEDLTLLTGQLRHQLEEEVKSCISNFFEDSQAAALQPLATFGCPSVGHQTSRKRIGGQLATAPAGNEIQNSVEEDVASKPKDSSQHSMAWCRFKR